MYARVRNTAGLFHLALVVFLLLSASDFFLTWKLIGVEDSEIAEINPIALTVLETCGWGGMATYKVALVVGIAGLIATIHLRRPRAGEAVMVFGCGAQAAVVITGLLLLRNVGANEPPELNLQWVTLDPIEAPSLPAGAMALLPHPAIQYELQLESEMVWRIAICQKNRREFCRQLGHNNMVDCRVWLSERLAQEQSLAISLTATQKKRLYELTLQARGPLAFSDVEVVNALRLTDKQVGAMMMIMGGRSVVAKGIMIRQDSRGQELGVEDELAETKSRLWGVLNAAQRDAWQEMLGAPFRFDAVIVSEVVEPRDAEIE